MRGMRVVKARGSGFKLVDVRDDRVVLGDNDGGASVRDVARFLKA
jgi:hypothetical protein